MNWLKFSFVVVILCTIKCIVTSQDYTALSRDTLESEYGVLKYAGLIFRHGNRIPEKLYPEDPHKSYPWPSELGQLTNEGKNRAFSLGKYFEPRYSSLTGKSYSPSKVIMHASSYDRTLMSGQLFNAGYFQPTGAAIWNKDISWQPIPIHTIPAAYDNVIRLSRPCPRLQKYKKDFYENSATVKKLCADYANLFTYVEKHTGLNLTPCNSEASILNLLFVQDALLIETEHNLTLPEWTAAVFPEPLNTFRGSLLYMETEDPIVKRLLAGPLLNVFASDMLNIAKRNNTLPENIYTSKPSETRPLHLFAGHDTDLIMLMRVLKVYNLKAPNYSAALAFELRAKDDEHYVTLEYVNSLNEPPQRLRIHNCEENCTLEKFLSIITPLIPSDWEAECRSDYVDTTITTAPGTPSSSATKQDTSSQYSGSATSESTTWTPPPASVLANAAKNWTKYVTTSSIPL